MNNKLQYDSESRQPIIMGDYIKKQPFQIVEFLTQNPPFKVIQSSFELF